ncbi:MAG: anti-phage defense ZorAB system ZorA [Clostridiales bacterium]|nr:anti-phage defense ZorAB system ZorA [Clostridiales bacterium]
MKYIGNADEVIYFFMALIAVVPLFFTHIKLLKVMINTKKAKKYLKSQEKVSLANLRYLQNLRHIGPSIRQYLKSKESSSGSYTYIDSYLDSNYMIERYGKRKLANTIPGILTALGILGTFWGLTIGLKEINMGSIAETSETIKQLLNGVSIAFHTSLWGIVLSLIWNFCDKIFIEFFSSYINDFIDVFNLKSGIIKQNEDELLINLLEEQSSKLGSLEDHFRTFGDDISLKLADSLGEAIKKEMTPHLEEMANQNNRLVEAITGNQVEGMDKMVGHLMDEVNGLFGDQFENMSDTIEELLKWQKEVKSSMDELVNKIQDTAKLQSVSNKEMDSLLTKNLDLITKVNDSSIELNKIVDNAKEVCNSFDALVNDNQSHKDIIHGYSEKISSSLSLFKDLTENIDEQATMYSEELNSLNKNFQVSSESFATNLVQGIDNTFKSFDDNLSSITRHLAEVIREIKNSSDDMPDILEEIKENIKNFSEVVGQINEMKDIG